MAAKTANTVFRSAWAFISPSEKDWAIYPSYAGKTHSQKLQMAQNEKWVSASNATRISKIVLVSATALIGIALITIASLSTAGVITLPQAVSTTLFGVGGIAEGLGLSTLIALIRRNQSDKGRGLPFCHKKPFHFVANILSQEEDARGNTNNKDSEPSTRTTFLHQSDSEPQDEISSTKSSSD